MGLVITLSPLCGMGGGAPPGAGGGGGAEPSWIQKALLGPGSHLALAILCSKVMIPIKLPIALAITPYVYR